MVRNLALFLVLCGVATTAAKADDYCPALAHALGDNLPVAVAGSTQGTRCGHWNADVNGQKWDIVFMLSVKGQNVAYATYRFFEPIKVAVDHVKWDGTSLTFDAPLKTLNGDGSPDGTVYFSFGVTDGKLDAKSVTKLGNGTQIPFAATALAPFPKTGTQTSQAQ